MSVKQITIEPYGWVLNVALGEESAKKWRAKYWPDDEDPDFGKGRKHPRRRGTRRKAFNAVIGYMDYNENGASTKRWLMMVPEHLDRSTIMHEALHCAVMMMEESGQEANYDTQEGLAYAQEHIVREVLRKCFPAAAKQDARSKAKSRTVQ